MQLIRCVLRACEFSIQHFPHSDVSVVEMETVVHVASTSKGSPDSAHFQFLLDSHRQFQACRHEEPELPSTANPTSVCWESFKNLCHVASNRLLKIASLDIQGFEFLIEKLRAAP